MKSRRLTTSLVFPAVVVALALLAWPAATQVRPGLRTEFHAGHLVAANEALVKFRAEPAPDEIAMGTDAAETRGIGGEGVRRIRSKSLNTTALLASLRHRPDVDYAEPNYIVRANLPNDPLFPYLWGLVNTGQTVGGSPGADIAADQAWGKTTGNRDRVVGVVDTGIAYTHTDLAANVWRAPSSFTVFIGGQGITCAQGSRGFNAISGTCDPADDNNHGTHVSGTIGATGNNSTGVVGVNWTTSIMGLKFLDVNGQGTIADAVDAIEFAIQAKKALGGGADVAVLSNSWGGGGYSQALLNAINSAEANGMLFVAAAGNAGTNNDVTPSYPASYRVANVIAVAATDNRDALASFSNYGPSSVHLGAPGVNIYSTVRNNGYGPSSGTSMAVPHVSGAAALLLAACPTLDTASLKSTILANTDPITALATKTVTGGRLNVGSAMNQCSSLTPTDPPAEPVPAPDFALTASPSSLTLRRGATGSVNVTATTSGGFAGLIALSVSQLTGVTATLSSSTLNPGGSGTLTVTAASNAKKGTYSVTVTGSSGSLSDATTLSVKVR